MALSKVLRKHRSLTNFIVRHSSKIVSSPFRDVPLSKLPYHDYLFENVSFHRQRTALVNGVTGESWTFGETYDKSVRFSDGLRGKYYPDCQVLGIFLPNCIEYPVVFSGSARAGIVTTTINPTYTSYEIGKQLELANCSHVVTNRALLPSIKETEKLLGRKLSTIVTDGCPEEHRDSCVSLSDILEDQSVEPFQHASIDVINDTVTLPFSSGTTGTPKGVMLTHFNLVANMSQYVGDSTHHDIKIIDESTEYNQNVALGVLPLYHIYAMNVAMGPCIRAGAKLVMLPKFDPQLWISSLEKYRPTHLNLAPPLVQFMVNSPHVTPEHLDSVVDCLVAAAPTGPALYEQFHKKFPQTVIRDAWGMTELSPGGCVTPKSKVKPGSSGPTLPNNKLKVVDVGTGELKGPNEPGELCIQGPMIMKGYINNKEATEQTIRDGWLHSGDVAYYDEDGYIFIVDRIKELIKVKGFQVPPAEIEDLLRALEGVKDVAVIGVPHEKYGEVPRAYVVKHDGAQGLTEDSVKAYVAEKLTEYKKLEGGVEFIEVIPKSAAGKILRRLLVEQYKENLCLTNIKSD